MFGNDMILVFLALVGSSHGLWCYMYAGSGDIFVKETATDGEPCVTCSLKIENDGTSWESCVTENGVEENCKGTGPNAYSTWGKTKTGCCNSADLCNLGNHEAKEIGYNPLRNSNEFDKDEDDTFVPRKPVEEPKHNTNIRRFQNAANSAKQSACISAFSFATFFLYL